MLLDCAFGPVCVVSFDSWLGVWVWSGGFLTLRRIVNFIVFMLGLMLEDGAGYIGGVSVWGDVVYTDDLDAGGDGEGGGCGGGVVAVGG